MNPIIAGNGGNAWEGAVHSLSKWNNGPENRTRPGKPTANRSPKRANRPVNQPTDSVPTRAGENRGGDRREPRHQPAWRVVA